MCINESSVNVLCSGCLFEERDLENLEVSYLETLLLFD